jgi:hypothetical protein
MCEPRAVLRHHRCVTDGGAVGAFISGLNFSCRQSDRASLFLRFPPARRQAPRLILSRRRDDANCGRIGEPCVLTDREAVSFLRAILRVVNAVASKGILISSSYALSWCRGRDSNPRPTHYECVALPAELPRHARPRSIQLKCGLDFSFEHNLIRKPVTTFRDHALRQRPSNTPRA